MKYVGYDKTGKITGFYETEIHKNIPEASIPISEEEWLDCAQYTNYRKVNIDTKTIIKQEIPKLTALVDWDLFINSLLANETYNKITQLTNNERAVARLESAFALQSSRWSLIEKFWNQMVEGLSPNPAKPSFSFTIDEIEALNNLCKSCNMPFTLSPTGTLILPKI